MSIRHWSSFGSIRTPRFRRCDPIGACVVTFPARRCAAQRNLTVPNSSRTSNCNSHPYHEQPTSYKVVMKLILLLAALATLLLLIGLPAHGATFRWASTSDRIYVENGGSPTLTDIKTALPNAPLDFVDPPNKV